MPKNKTRCYDDRMGCFACGINRQCKVLTDTGFIGNCPFYKTAEQRKQEHRATLKRLKETGQFDLFDKYVFGADYRDTMRGIK